MQTEEKHSRLNYETMRVYVSCISWSPFLSSPSNDFWKFTCGVGNSLPSYCKPPDFSHSEKDGCCTYVARYVKFNTPTEYSNWMMSCNCTAR